MSGTFDRRSAAILAALAVALVGVTAVGATLIIGNGGTHADQGPPVTTAALQPVTTAALQPSGSAGPAPSATPAGATRSTRPASTGSAHRTSAASPEGPTTSDLGWITAVTRAPDGRLRITYDRVIWLSGAQARAHNQGVEPDNGYVIVNDNPLLRTVPLAPSATVIGVATLGLDDNSASPETLTQNQFYTLTQAALRRGVKPLVQLRHLGVHDPTVVKVEEQYLP